MVDDFAFASELFGTKRVEERASKIGTSTIYGIASGDSSDGMVYVQVDGDLTNEDGETSVLIPTSPAVRNGDTVLITMSGGVAKSPMVTAVSGEGDRQNARIIENENNITIAIDSQEVISSDLSTVSGAVSDLQSSAESALQDIDNLQSAVDLQAQVLADVTTTFTFDANGLVIGKTNSEMKSVFSNDALRFQAGGQDVLVLDAVSSTASADKFGIGKYQWKSVDNGDAIALVYVG